MEKKIRILLVEDDQINRDVIKKLLSEKYDVDIATSGIQAVEMASLQSYDILLMDINLGKGMSGIDATQAIRKLEGYEKTPIVAVTAFAMAGDKEEFLSKGCTHYLSKPFGRKELTGLLESIEKDL